MGEYSGSFQGDTMGCQSSVIIGNNLVFSICTHDPDTGVLTDADTNPSYRLYEDQAATPILSGTLSKLDDVNTTGFYTALVACTTANGFEAGKTYTIYIAAVVNGATGGIAYSFNGMLEPLSPTVPGRTLDVTASGNTGIDWGNIEGQGLTVNLTSTTVHTVTQASMGNYPASNIFFVDEQTLEDKIPAILSKTTNLPAYPAATSDIPSANSNADALLDRVNAIETGFSLRQALRVVLSALAGKLSGGGTTNITIRDATDTKNRIVATVDSDGNRTNVTLDGS
jgi:hypothetical protein